MRRGIAIRALFASLLVLFAAGARAEPKLRIAVLEFTEKGAGHWSGHVGKATEDWFVDSLVNTQKFTVLEREQLRQLLSEKSFQASGEVSQATAVKAGKMAGVQVVVFGNIDFAQKDQDVHSNGTIANLLKSKIPLWGSASRKTSEGNLTARVVDVKTGEILFSKSETVSTSNFKLDILGTGGGTDWDETVVRKVFQPAVEKITEEIVAKLEGMKESVGASASGLEGKIAALKDGMVFVSLGKLDGVKTGDKFEVVRAEVIKDPDTNEELGRDEKVIGQITVNKLAGEHLSSCKVDSGSDFAKGDVVKRK